MPNLMILSLIYVPIRDCSLPVLLRNQLKQKYISFGLPKLILFCMVIFQNTPKNRIHTPQNSSNLQF